jgi:hypothetical protein
VYILLLESEVGSEFYLRQPRFYPEYGEITQCIVNIPSEFLIESELSKPDEKKHVVALKNKAQEEGRPVVVISAQIESELSVRKCGNGRSIY